MPDTPTAPSAALSPARSGPIAWLRSEIDRMAEDLGRPSRDFFLGSLSAFHSPRIDMLEKDGAYNLTAELPGLTEKDVNVTVTDHALVISGEKKSDDERRDDGFLLRERRYGSFERHVPLPLDARDDGIEARFNKGVLTVTVPKGEGEYARGRRIEIHAG